MRPAMAALLVCAVSVRARTEPDLPRVVPQPDTDPRAEDAVRDRLILTDGGSGVDLATLADRQLATQKALSDLSDYVREALTTLRQELQQVQALAQREAQGAQVLGASCRGDSDCSALKADTVCSREGLCVCGEGLQEVAGGACRPYPRLSEPCRRNADCLGATRHSACSEHVCVCGEGYVRDSSAGCRRPRLSEACTEPSHCYAITEDSTCRDGQCVCQEHYWNDQGAACRPYPNVFEACNSTSECHGRSEGSACKDGVCACVEGYLPRWQSIRNERYDGCAKVVPLGESCSVDAECGTTREMVLSETATRFCVSGRCACGYKFINGFSIYVRLHGGSDCEGGYVRDADSGEILCDADFTSTDADVLCRSLGFSGGRPGQPGEAPPLDDFICMWGIMTCSGTEREVIDCRWSLNDRKMPVSVKCSKEE